jgi:hypothetical protein
VLISRRKRHGLKTAKNAYFYVTIIIKERLSLQDFRKLSILMLLISPFLKRFFVPLDNGWKAGRLEA